MKHASPTRVSSAALRPDQSSCSSDTGDVLIRSSGILLPDRRREAGQGPGSVHISVQKLRETRQSHDTGAPLRAAEDGRPGHDLLTSRFTTGCRGVVLAALKQRSHSAPRSEVEVELLNPRLLQTSSQDAVGDAGVQTEQERFSGHLGNATNAVAAAAAAAVAATAPFIKAQSDMEARVCQLTDGVQQLLQAHREDGERGRGLNQLTRQHLEKLHSQQLQLQSQLLESALKIVTGHAPTTSTASDLTVSGPNPAHLQVTHLGTAANAHSNQQQSSLATRAAAALETDPVSIETPSCDLRPEQTREEVYRQAAPSLTSATHLRKETRSQSPANHSRVAAREAKEVLREMGRLKTEIKMLLTQPQDSLKTTMPPPDQHKSQQNLLQTQQDQDQQSQSQQNKDQQSQSQQNQEEQSQSQRPHSDQTKFQQSHFQSQQSWFQQNQSQSRKVPSHQTQPQQNQSQFQSQSVLGHIGPVVPSMLEKAGGVLRQVRRQRKVLEENLEALLRAKNGEVLHCQLEALATNRDWNQEVRIKRTVDAWISTLSKDVQAETPSEKAARSSAPSGMGRPTSVVRQTGSKIAGRRGGQGQRAGHRTGAEPVPGVLIDRDQVEGESYLTRLYGRAPYEGLRRTLKKSPYLRFSSPGSPLLRKPHPRLVESVIGVKVKSCKTQTSLTPPFSPSPERPAHHLILSSSHILGDPADLTVTPDDTVAMAIPLGRRRVDSSSRCVNQHHQEMTSLPTPPPTLTVAAEVGAPEQQSKRDEQLNAGEAPPLPPSHAVIETKSEDEENTFPGADFLSVADVLQVSSALPQEEEESVVGEEAVELDGGPSPVPLMYQGPAFPPGACSALPAQGQASTLDTNQHGDNLEERLVEWVEQQLMSRMISEMYHPPPSDPTHNLSTDPLEPEEQSVTSDIVEVVGGGGLQLFVDSNVLVDSALIRQLVKEVLTETVALMLGERDALDTGSEPGLEPVTPGPAAHQEDTHQVPLVPTPVPTPPPSPTITINQTTPPSTPPLSEPTSLLIEECPQPITAADLMVTPTPTPDPAPSTDPPPLTWGDAELPLDKERPEEHLDTKEQALVMTVAEEDPPLSSPSVSSPSPRGPDADPGPASPSSSVSSSSAALKYISEGEVLISVQQLTSTTEDGGAVCSLSSSLQELHDMDYDPPSEGQVRGHGFLLTLLTKMEQGVTPQGERPQPEGSWGRQDPGQEEEVSVGEVRENHTTESHRTTNPMDYSQSLAARRGQSSSPGQISQCSAKHEEEEEGGGTRRMAVHLPSVMAEEEVMEELSAAADTESSINDIFLETPHKPTTRL